MDANDEKFFEGLTGGKTPAGENYEVELAKASAGVLSTASARPKIIRMKNEEEREEKEEEENSEQEETAWADGEPEGKLTVDVYQTAQSVVVESAIAGVKASDIDVNVTSDSVTIRGSRKRDKVVKDEDYLYQECYWGRFARSIILPQEIDPDGADVTFKNGILTVTLPKANRKKSRKLRITID
jgi:HSP20 family protein